RRPPLGVRVRVVVVALAAGGRQGEGRQPRSGRPATEPPCLARHAATLAIRPSPSKRRPSRRAPGEPQRTRKLLLTVTASPENGGTRADRKIRVTHPGRTFAPSRLATLTEVTPPHGAKVTTAVPEALPF